MLKSFYLSLVCVGTVCSLFADGEIADRRGGGGGGQHRDDHRDYNHNGDHRNDFNHNEARREYNRYDNHNFYGGYNHYNRGAYQEGIYDGVLLNNTYNPDVEYTQPGSTDNFNQVYEQNLQ